MRREIFNLLNNIKVGHKYHYVIDGNNLVYINSLGFQVQTVVASVFFP
jgi:hypothetical protein